MTSGLKLDIQEENQDSLSTRLKLFADEGFDPIPAQILRKVFGQITIFINILLKFYLL